MRDARLALALAFLVLLPVPAAAQGDPGARSPVRFDANVLDVALGATNERLLVATADPGSRFPSGTPPATNPDEEVWYLLTADGRQVLQSGHADDEDCADLLGPDDCKTDASFIVANRDATRLVAGAVESPSNSVLVFAESLGGEAERLTIQGTLTGLAISDSGDAVVASWTLAASQPNDKRGGITFYPWGATVQTASIWTGRTDQATTGVALSPDGQSIAVAAGEHHYRFRRSGSASLVQDDGFPGKVTDVSISGSGKHLSAAGSDDGSFALHADDTPAGQRPVRIISSQQQSPTRAVAIRRDATAVAAGHDSGDLRIHWIDPARLLAVGSPLHLRLAAGITGLAFSGDGATLAVSTTAGVAQVGLDGQAGALLWQKDVASPVGLATSGNGEVVATAAGQEVLLFGAQHAAGFVLPAKPLLSPGGEGAYALGFRNTGNRVENATLSVTVPAGWSAALVPSTVSVFPGKTANLTLTVRAPDEAAPGTVALELGRDLRRGAGVQRSEFAVEVIPKRALVFEGALASTAIQPGQAKEVEVEVRNQGNVLTVARLVPTIDRPGWTVAAGNAPAIQPGTTGKATLIVTAPADAPQLQVARVHASLEGQPESSYELRAIVGARFVLELAAAPSLTVPPQGNTIAVTVTNRGNAVDTVRLEAGPLPTGWTASWPSGDNPHSVGILEPGAQATATLLVQPAAGAAAGTPIQLQVRALSGGDETQVATRSVLLDVEGSGTRTSTTGKGTPGFEIPLGVLAVALLALRRKGAQGR